MGVIDPGLGHFLALDRVPEFSPRQKKKKSLEAR
jgi:hypothetical protein